MFKRNNLIIYFKRFTVISSCLALLLVSGCANVNMDAITKTMKESVGKVVGAGLGVAAGAVVCNGDKACIAAFAVAGFALGALWDHRESKLKELAKKEQLSLNIKRTKTYNNKTKDDNVLEVIINDDDTMFAYNSEKLTPKSEVKFRKIAKLYAQNTQTVLIIGHTDAVGSDQYNQKLSEKRARYVAVLFEKEGVPRNRLYFQGVGESQPIASNQTPAGQAKNRRVELVETDSKPSLAAYTLTRQTNRKYLAHVAKTKKELAKIKRKHKRVTHVAKKPKGNKQTTVVVTKKPVAKRLIALVDFGGNKASSNISKLMIAMGEKEKEENIFSSIIPSAHATEGAFANFPPCYMDSPRLSGQVKSLDTEQALDLAKYATEDFIPGMAGTIWADKVNGHLIAISNVKVLQDSSSPVGKPSVSIYKNYTNGAKKDYKTTARVDTYRGTDGLFYRLFLTEKDPIYCIDLVLPLHKPFRAKAGMLYYLTNKGEYSHQFQPRQFQR